MRDISMDKPIEEVEFTIFDTETTGLDPQSGDRIVEMAAVKFQGERKIGQFHTLVNPQREISAGAYAVNKISSEMLQGAPDISGVLPGFFAFIQDSCLCSYNAGFDLEFLYYEISLQPAGGAIFEEAARKLLVVDILKMARRLLPGLERYSLGCVAQALGVRTPQEHRALSDVMLTWEVFKRLKDKFQEKGLRGFRHFGELFGMNRGFAENVSQQKVAQIQEALGLGGRLKIKYLSTSSAALTEREVLPKEIMVRGRQLYLVGYCCLRQEERSFRVDNILHIELLSRKER